jgi:predicted nucleotidyltransferase
MAAPVITNPSQVIPSQVDFEKILTAKLSYEAKQKTPEKDTWNKAHFNETPWGIAYNCSKAKYEKSAASYNKVKRKPNNPPVPKHDQALKYLIVAIAIDWTELIDQLKRNLKNWGFTSKDLQNIARNVWLEAGNLSYITTECDQASVTELIEQRDTAKQEELTEAIEKHTTLNSKLFTKDEVLKDKVRDKMLEIVDEFLADLKEQDIKIKVDDILLIGSNASYNYTKDSDIDLHILANAKAAEYKSDIAAALYGAYRTIFNKKLDITLYGIPLEIFVETEDSARVSNGVYSIKKNKWVKRPIQEDIPEYDTKALDELVDKWEADCKDLIANIKADKLDDEKKVVKMLEDIYEKLRKKGIAKGEYSPENLAFKELRNKGYLDQLKDYRNELVSKRLSLEEKLDRQTRIDIYNQLTYVAGTQPIIQDNGMFFIYNLKASGVDRVLSALRKLPFVAEAQANENGKYDFSNTLDLAMNKMPKKYYNIRGLINYKNV